MNSHKTFDTYTDVCCGLSEYIYDNLSQSLSQDLSPELCQDGSQINELLQDLSKSLSEDLSKIDEMLQDLSQIDNLSPVLSPVLLPVLSPANNINPRFSPRKEDSLFWSIYIAKHGVGEFMNIDRYHNTELAEKQKIITTFQKAPATLKHTNMKISNVAIQEILADLMINKRTQLPTIIALSVFYGIEIYLVNESTHVFLRYTPHTFTETAIVYKNTHVVGVNELKGNGSTHVRPKSDIANYSVHTTASRTEITGILSNMIELEHGKPFRGISHYKVEDLEQIAEKANIAYVTESGKKMKKTELYTKIVETCVL